MNTHKEPARGIPVPHRGLYETEEEYQHAREKYQKKLDYQWGVEPLGLCPKHYKEKLKKEKSVEPKEEREYQEYKKAEEKRIYDIEHDYVRPTPPSQIEEEVKSSFEQGYELGSEHARTLALKDMELAIERAMPEWWTELNFSREEVSIRNKTIREFRGNLDELLETLRLEAINKLTKE